MALPAVVEELERMRKAWLRAQIKFLLVGLFMGAVFGCSTYLVTPTYYPELRLRVSLAMFAIPMAFVLIVSGYYAFHFFRRRAIALKVLAETPV